MTVLSLDLARTNVDKFNKPKIIKIEQVEAEIFNIFILGSKQIDLDRKKVLTFTLENSNIGWHLHHLSPKPFLPGPLEENVFLNR